jgi:protein SCO1/2
MIARKGALIDGDYLQNALVDASCGRRRFLASGLAALLAACGRQEAQPKFNATDISVVDWGRGFDLTDHSGRRRTLADFKGKVVMVFFGYTNCLDACPLALAEMAQAVMRLGPDAGRVQGLFITVDPERDTQEVLSKYVPAFHPSFLGLRGTPEEASRAAKEFKVYFQLNKKEVGDPRHYLVDHTAGIFVLDVAGKPRLYVSASRRTVDRMVEDLRRLLAS